MTTEPDWAELRANAAAKGEPDRVHETDSRWSVFRDEPNHGWVPWYGQTAPFFDDEAPGPRPIENGCVDVWLRSGRIIFYRSPKHIGGRKNSGGGWVHLGEVTDIVAYRIHPEPVYNPAERDGIIPF